MGDCISPAAYLGDINDELYRLHCAVVRSPVQISEHAVDVEIFSFGRNGHTRGRNRDWDLVLPLCELH